MKEVKEDLRFHGVARLYGQEAFKKLQAAHICIVGVGGVGSWAAEAVVRSGVGEVTLVDLDEVCLSNTNRQLHALKENVGRSKVQVLRERFLQINPDCQIHAVEDWLGRDNVTEILAPGFDCVIDAIDSVMNKCLLLSECRRQEIPVVTTGAAGGKLDPSKIQIKDMTATENDRLIYQCRRLLRRKFDFPRGKERPFHIPAVFSVEAPFFYLNDTCVSQQTSLRPSGPLDCATGFGTASFVTGTFGFMAASVAIQEVLKKP